jgi:DNA invertase Pin-like site-specific DNA recombinase
MKVALYARTSTRDKGQNPEMQLEPLRRYCEVMGWEIYKNIPIRRRRPIW